jgi:hypothetical protein
VDNHKDIRNTMSNESSHAFGPEMTSTSLSLHYSYSTQSNVGVCLDLVSTAPWCATQMHTELLVLV